MKEAIVSGYEDGALKVSIHDVHLPTPEPSQVVVKVMVAGTNPKDWKGPLRLPAQNHTNPGDDMAGFVHSVGASVQGFKIGDRVAALHPLKMPHGTFAEYAVAEEHSTFPLPESIPFEEGATKPLAAMTAAIGLFCNLGLPEPWQKNDAVRAQAAGGVMVYGAASAVGAIVIKLLLKTNVHPIIAVAGRSTDLVEKLIDRARGDVIVDYRKGDNAVVEGIKNAIQPGQRIRHAFDAVSEHGSYLNIAKAIEPDSFLTTVTPGFDYAGLPEEMNQTLTFVPTAFDTNKDFATAWFRLFYHGLKEGWLTGHPFEIISGGLDGVEEGLLRLRDGKASGMKYVYQIGTI